MSKKYKQISFQKHRHATWLELFFDLVFVAGISSTTHLLMHAHDGHLGWRPVYEFAVAFIPMWWIWATQTYYANRFDTDSTRQRLVTLLIMFLFAMMATLFGEGILTHARFKGFAVFYIVIRLIQAGLFVHASRDHLKSKQYAKKMAFMIGLGATLLSLTAFLGHDFKGVLFLCLVFMEMFLMWLFVRKNTKSKIHQGHLVERVGLLSIILLGESVIAMVSGLRGGSWNLYSVAATAVGFLLIGSIWWIYFNSFYVLERARRMRHGLSLLYSHLFFCIGLAILAALIQHTISNSLSMADFRYLAVSAMILFYIGKQTSYFVCFPVFRVNNIINSFVCIGLTVLSTFLPNLLWSLSGITLAMFFYTYSNLAWTLKKNADPYLMKN